jgi:hypothetical protein
MGFGIYNNIIFYCFMISTAQERSAAATILAIYLKGFDQDLLRVREPRSHIAEKWTELEWQALFQPPIGTSTSLRERKPIVINYRQPCTVPTIVPTKNAERT